MVSWAQSQILDLASEITGIIMWGGVLPTGHGKMAARCLERLYVTELILLLMVFRRVPSLCIFGPYIHGGGGVCQCWCEWRCPPPGVNGSQRLRDPQPNVRSEKSLLDMRQNTLKNDWISSCLQLKCLTEDMGWELLTVSVALFQAMLAATVEKWSCTLSTVADEIENMWCDEPQV